MKKVKVVVGSGFGGGGNGIQVVLQKENMNEPASMGRSVLGQEVGSGSSLLGTGCIHYIPCIKVMGWMGGDTSGFIAYR